MICSKFITFVVEMTTWLLSEIIESGCDLLKIHYLCGRNDNIKTIRQRVLSVVICSKFITFVVEMTTESVEKSKDWRCDLLKIHYLCGRNDNLRGDEMAKNLL